MKTIIQETNKGYLVLGELYTSLTAAIEAAGPEYTFIPFARR